MKKDTGITIKLKGCCCYCGGSSSDELFPPGHLQTIRSLCEVGGREGVAGTLGKNMAHCNQSKEYGCIPALQAVRPVIIGMWVMKVRRQRHMRM